MGSIFKPKINIPPPPAIEEPPAEVPTVDDPETNALEEQRLQEMERKRKGRRSTILTGSQGLNEIEEENIINKTLLGG